MSIDILQDKIRKLKNPSVIDFSVMAEHIPPHIRQGASTAQAYDRFCRELLEGLKGIVPAVRFSFDVVLIGQDGAQILSGLLNKAAELGYYVFLDGTAVMTPWSGQRAALAFFGEDTVFPCDGLIISPYIGTDAVKPFIPYCKDQNKDLFLAVRTANKTAPELQDLLTGTRHVHTAAVDLLIRQGESILGRCGYSRVAALVSAGSAPSLTNLRGKYKRLFMLVDGVDYPSGNAKNCSYAFDRMGHGAIVCAGPSVTAAWYSAETDGSDFVTQAVDAAERLKKNILRYITVV